MTRPTVAERLERGATRDESTGCLVWQRCVNSRGYSQVSVDGKVLLGHRVAWELVNGPIADGMTIDHLCVNKRCLEVAHMETVTRAENSQRGNRLPANTPRCVNGHGRVGGNAPAVAATCTVCAREQNPVDQYGLRASSRGIAAELQKWFEEREAYHLERQRERAQAQERAS